MEKKGISAGEELEAMAAAGQVGTLAAHQKMLRIAENEHIQEEYAKHMSPRGALPHVTGLLDERRLEYGIPDEAFNQEAVFDRVFLWQIPRVFSQTAENSSIILPETARQRREESTPRGIILTAGLKALDNLRSNGMDLGHVVSFIRLSPWRLPVLEISGIEFTVMVLRDGDIIASEELVQLRRRGAVVTAVGGKAGEAVYHYLASGPVPSAAPSFRPTQPWIPDDM